jgi:beta-galactosidase
VVPGAKSPVTFTVSGPGVIAAVDNANNSSHESFQTNVRDAFHGRCVTFVKANADGGEIQVTAGSPGLADGEVTVQAKSTP